MFGFFKGNNNTPKSGSRDDNKSIQERVEDVVDNITPDNNDDNGAMPDSQHSEKDVYGDNSDNVVDTDSVVTDTQDNNDVDHYAHVIDENSRDESGFEGDINSEHTGNDAKDSTDIFEEDDSVVVSPLNDTNTNDSMGEVEEYSEETEESPEEDKVSAYDTTQENASQHQESSFDAESPAPVNEDVDNEDKGEDSFDIIEELDGFFGEDEDDNDDTESSETYAENAEIAEPVFAGNVSEEDALTENAEGVLDDVDSPSQEGDHDVDQRVENAYENLADDISAEDANIQEEPIVYELNDKYNTESIDDSNVPTLLTFVSDDDDTITSSLSHYLDGSPVYVVDLSTDKYGYDIIPGEAELKFIELPEGDSASHLDAQTLVSEAATEAKRSGRRAYIVVVGADNIANKLFNHFEPGTVAHGIITDYCKNLLSSAHKQGVSVAIVASAMTEELGGFLRSVEIS